MCFRKLKYGLRVNNGRLNFEVGVSNVYNKKLVCIYINIVYLDKDMI